MTLRFKKKSDGQVALSYVREDGTPTWSTYVDAFFALHDLDHFAVETTLGLKRAFLGLVADGWDLTDFGSPWPRGRFAPQDGPQLMLAEFLAGALTRDRLPGALFTASEFNDTLRQRCDEEGIAAAPSITDDQLAAIRARREPLHARWLALPRGETLELTFPCP